jgi:hypothetical protein
VGRIARGWYLAKVSLRVVRSDGTLGVLVVLGGIASGATALGFLVPAAVAYSIEETWLAGSSRSRACISRRSWRRTSPSRSRRRAPRCSTGGTRPSAAEPPSRRRIWGDRRLGARTHHVNLVIQALRSRAGIIGSLLLGAATVAWGLATFLVVPIVALEGLGPLAALDRSASLFRRSGASSSSGRRRSACCSPCSARSPRLR